MVEINPTYKRTKEQLNEIKAKAGEGKAFEPESASHACRESFPLHNQRLMGDYH